jgi:hypothetical protein
MALAANIELLVCKDTRTFRTQNACSSGESSACKLEPHLDHVQLICWVLPACYNDQHCSQTNRTSYDPNCPHQKPALHGLLLPSLHGEGNKKSETRYRQYDHVVSLCWLQGRFKGRVADENR